ncbi:DUF4251 domain-containing protein [Pedobacter hartonius]|uniref:DUF4251 domain-containing protein n=1 Tax=Pedobacter hartonius TaxID=425514 RepID=A0A1H3ZCV6_9SPHI|nr:DUF4251 domain-containing protein [Pedobacter hartonius]SEA21201.1 protein of unknown function [Pedobacter hartonius]
MKTLKNIFLFALLFSVVKLSAQTDKATTARIIAAQNYVFVATTAYPLNAADINKIMSRLPGYNGGGNINLTGSSYDLSVTTDSLVAYLPYYGRSYTPKYGSIDENGIKFKSKDFNYKSSARKKGGWNITMTPKDIKDNYSLTLLITTSGYGTLTVNSNNQQSITFNGYIAETKPKKAG